MSRRAGWVTVGGSLFSPDDKIPAELAKQITNPKVHGEDSTEPTPAPEVGAVPPRSGAGSARDAWAVYAANNGVEVDAEASREDIIAALDTAGVPTL